MSRKKEKYADAWLSAAVAAVLFDLALNSSLNPILPSVAAVLFTVLAIYNFRAGDKEPDSL